MERHDGWDMGCAHAVNETCVFMKGRFCLFILLYSAGLQKVMGFYERDDDKNVTSLRFHFYMLG
jgi:hypothetical protein